MSLPNSSSTYNPTAQSTNTQFMPQSQTLHPKNSRSFYFVRRLIFVLLTLFVMVILIDSIAWSILHPRGPIIRVNSLSVSNITPSTPNYDIELDIKNPNKKINMLIDHFNIKVLCGRTPLSRTLLLPPFDLGKTNQTNKKAKLGRELGNSMHGRGFKNKRQANLSVVIDIRTTFRAWYWLTKRSLMEFRCMNLIVELSAKGTGKLIGGGKDCSFFFR